MGSSSYTYLDAKHIRFLVEFSPSRRVRVGAEELDEGRDFSRQQIGEFLLQRKEVGGKSSAGRAASSMIVRAFLPSSCGN